MTILNCEKDDNIIKESSNLPISQYNGHTVKKLTLEEAKQRVLIKDALDKIENQLDYKKREINPTLTGKNDPIKSKDNAFTVLTDEIIQVSTDSTEVYTFKIETPTKTSSSFENFIIHIASDGSIKYYIYRYHSYDYDFSFLKVSREAVDEEQINIGDFSNYTTTSKMMYDAASGCFLDVSSVNGILTITFLGCSDIGSGGFNFGTGSFSSNGSIPSDATFGNWTAPFQISENGSCIRSRPVLDASGNALYSDGSPLILTEYNIDCLTGAPLSESESTTSGIGTTDTGDFNYDTLHDVNTTGGGGTTTSTDTTNDSDPQDDGVVGVLPPDRLELETEDFFNNNQARQLPGYDGALIAPEIKNFASEAIDAHCNDGEVDFDERIIYGKSWENYLCQKNIVEKALKAGSPITDLIQDIFNSDKKAILNFITEDLNNIFLGGVTNILSPPSNFLIRINTERLEVSTDIDIANTAIHESVHATLFYFLLNGSFESSNESYGQLVEDFTKHQAGFGGNHHEYMTSLVNNIADASYNWAVSNGYSPSAFIEFDTSSDPKNGLQEYLGKISWNGLTETETFKAIFPEGSIERKNLIDLINSESLPYESTANPKGVPCN